MGATAFVADSILDDAVALKPALALVDRPLAPPDTPFVFGNTATRRRAGDRDSFRRRALALADALAILLAFAIVSRGGAFDANGSMLVLALAIPAWIVLHKTLRLYDRDQNRIHKSTLDELPTILQSLAFGSALVFLVAPMVGAPEIPRTQVLLFWALGSSFTVLLRMGARAHVRRALPAERMLIVGSGKVASMYARKVSAHPEYESEVIGYVDEPGSQPRKDGEVELLGNLRDFERLCKEERVERVLIGFGSLDNDNLLDVVRVSKRLRLKISIVPRLFEAIGPNVEVDQVEGMTVLGLRGVNRTWSTLALKRAVDIAGAVCALALAAPVMLVAALAVRLTSRGPVFFRQARVGRGHEAFEILKFRTMVDGADAMKDSLRDLNEMDGKMFKIANDPRVTPVGRFLRRTSLDELPQLINVLRGEMSLVGPRPLVPDENANIIGWNRARLDLTPGLTGPWQVMGRNAIPFDEMVKLDYLYVAEWSLWNDVKLLVRTLPVVFGQRGS